MQAKHSGAMRRSPKPQSGVRVLAPVPRMEPQVVGRVIFGADEMIAKWVGLALPVFSYEPGSVALGVLNQDGSDLVAGVVFDGYNSQKMDVAIRGAPGRVWATRETLYILFSYPFLTAGVHRLQAGIPASNKPSIKLCMHLGFEPEARLQQAAHDGSDTLVLRMFRHECRWIELHGQEKRAASAP